MEFTNLLRKSIWSPAQLHVKWLLFFVIHTPITTLILYYNIYIKIYMIKAHQKSEGNESPLHKTNRYL